MSNAPKTMVDVVSALKLDEAHDILAAMKNIVEEDGGVRAKMILDAHPQLIPALIHIQQRLGMSVPPDLLEPPTQDPYEETRSQLQQRVCCVVLSHLPNSPH